MTTSTLSADERRNLKALFRRVDGRGGAQLLSHLSALAVTSAGVTVARDTLWLWLAMALHGVVLVFLFAPLHETIHRTAFRRRWLNDAVAWMCGAVLALPPKYFRAFHFSHHRHTQDPERDPELRTPKPQTLGTYLWCVSGLPYWRDRIESTLRHATGSVREPFITPEQGRGIVNEARGLWALYVLIAAVSLLAQSSAAVTYWLLPVLLGQPFLRLYLLAEHTGCPYVPEMLANSRTTRSTALVRWLAWNMPFHAEHHLYPALPFHALPRAHAVLNDKIAVQAPGYGAVHREIVTELLRRGRAVSNRYG